MIHNNEYRPSELRIKNNYYTDMLMSILSCSEQHSISNKILETMRFVRSALASG